MGHDSDSDSDDELPKKKSGASKKCHDFRHFMWNSDKKEFMGRRGSNWAKLGLFYLTLYACLAGFFAAMMAGFLAFIDESEPTMQGLQSMIKSNPGMAFWPQISISNMKIEFTYTDPGSYAKHIENIEEMLNKYEVDQSRMIVCNESHRQMKNDTQLCQFNVTEQLMKGNCTKENKYGFQDGKPCVLLKVNQVYGWQPIPFDEAALNDTSNKFAQEAKNVLGSRMNSSYIGVSCEKEDATGNVNATFYPDLGFSFAYFPYYNHDGYLAPLVFAQMEVEHGVLVKVWCKMWVSNIKHNKNDRAGSIRFEIKVQ